MTSDTKGIDQFHAALGAYVVWNKRDQGQLIADRGKKLSVAIYKVYRGTAEKSKTALREKIFAETGYELKRRMNPFTSKRLTWAQEVNVRAGGVAVLATSWLHTRWRSNQAKGRFLRVNRVGKRMGEIVADAAPGNATPSILLASFLQGAVALNQQRRLVSQACYYQAADMQKYIARKHQEKLAALFREPFTAAISA